jgi:hypothetical protein
VSAAVFNIKVEQGATFRFPKFQFGTLLVDAEGAPIPGPDGNPQIDVPRDFTGCTFRLQMRASKKPDGDEFFTVTSEDSDGGISADDQGVITIVVPDEQTDKVVKNGFYDLKCYNPDQTEDRLVEGAVSVSTAVTTDELVVSP